MYPSHLDFFSSDLHNFFVVELQPHFWRSHIRYLMWYIIGRMSRGSSHLTPFFSREHGNDHLLHQDHDATTPERSYRSGGEFWACTGRFENKGSDRRVIFASALASKTGAIFWIPCNLADVEPLSCPPGEPLWKFSAVPHVVFSSLLNRSVEYTVAISPCRALVMARIEGLQLSSFT